MADFQPAVYRVDRQGGFAAIPAANIKRSVFDRSFGHKLTMEAPGVLYPVFVDEALPGDTINLKATAFVRMATPIKPILDSVFVDLFWFATPNRILWSNWKKFMGEQINPGDSISFVTPKVNSGAGGFARLGLFDYLGIPPQQGTLTGVVNALPARAYLMLFNEWFRDQNLQPSVPVPTGDGPDNEVSYSLQISNKRHDYFTSALPWPQKGTAVTLPLGTTAPLVGNPGGAAVDMTMLPDGGTNTGTIARSGTTANSSLVFEPTDATVAASANMRWVNPGINLAATAPGGTTPYANLAGATAATINQWREAMQIQALLERDARAGTRYTEVIRAHFGVLSDDGRQQRPEFLGSQSFSLNVNPVPQTSNTPASGTAQGNLAAFIAGAGSGRGFSKSFTEHCIVMCVARVRGDLHYQQGINKMFLRSTRYDYYWPALAGLGEQPILSREIYADGSAGDDTVFGYQERYAEYRYKPSQVSGKFRSSHAQTLDSWHLAQQFASRPTLNSAFIIEQPPINRVIAVPSESWFLADFFFDYKHVRPMPVYGIPANLTRF